MTKTNLEKAEELALSIMKVEEITGKPVATYRIDKDEHWVHFDRPLPAVQKTTVQTTEVSSNPPPS